jgi:ABC-type polysaccharide/polyol phosphate export permease
VKTARVFWIGWLLHFKIMSRSPFAIGVGATWPVVNATLAYFMYRAGGHPQTLLYASLGSAVAGIWSMSAIDASGAIQRQRWWGTLELLVGAPVPFAQILLPMTLAISSAGIYCLATTLVWGRLVYGIPLPLEDPLAFVLAVPVTIGSVGVLGFALGMVLVRFRTASSLGNSLEYPVWIASGLLFPIAVLPAWSHPISWALATTWGMRALLESARGGGHPWQALAMCAALATLYAAIGIAILERFMDAARRRATLSLT